MFVQDNVYVATEYGTRFCDEDREPCGAFYGIPFSGEVEDLPIYERDQINAAMPDRWFSKRDEKVLAIMRGEIPSEQIQAGWKNPADIKDDKERRCAELVNDFVLNCNPFEYVLQKYKELVVAYVKGGKNYLLNDILRLYETYKRK